MSSASKRLRFYNKKTPENEYLRQQQLKRSSMKKHAKVLSPSFLIPDVQLDQSEESFNENPLETSEAHDFESFSETPCVQPKKSGKKKGISKAVLRRELTNFGDDLLKNVWNVINDQSAKIASLEEEVSKLHEIINQSSKNSSSPPRNEGKLPPDLSAMVRLVYKSFGEENQWNIYSNKRFDCVENSAVTMKIIEALKNDENQFSEKEMKAACARYFSHLKRRNKELTEMSPRKHQNREKMKRCAARRSRLLMKRKSKALKLDLNEKEIEIVGKLTSELMTDEETGDEETLIARHIPWRSEELNELFKKIDGISPDTTGVQKKRVEGDVSTRTPSQRLPQEFCFCL